MTFFNFDKLLVTVRAADSRSVAQIKSRFVNLPGKAPQNPDDLMQRLLSAMVDHYLELRQPMAQRLDGLQHALLDPRKPFRDWAKLLESRQQIRELQNLSEEQRDAVQEWRDYRIADLSPAMHARFADIVEHIERVLNHARTTESQAESAVQLYFAAMSHRTTEIMRLLTLITAIFMPLTLITGLFGMNFEFIPGLHKSYGFWLSVAAMVGVVTGMLAYFRHKRWV
jgi:magnesium/cobalt transport protein CorA